MFNHSSYHRAGKILQLFSRIQLFTIKVPVYLKAFLFDKIRRSLFALLTLILFFGVVSCSLSQTKPDDINDRVLIDVQEQLTYSHELIDELINKNIDNEYVAPRSVNSDNTVKLVSSKDWCSGFYAGIFWQIAKISDDEKWVQIAKSLTAPLEQEKYNAGTHDMGFKMLCSYGNGYLKTSDPEYRKILITAAETLITRFNKNVGCIRSWDHNSDKWDFPVIIDNMMNLELLFWATRETGDPIYYNIAVKHAETTLKNHFRKDNSSYHVIDYDPDTGSVKNRHTHQGYAHESSWSRGQAWGLYGYTMVYRETKDKRFLKQAEKIADYIISHPNLPENKIPYWDFNAPNIPNEPYDASAAAITASALYELSEYSSKNHIYKGEADDILRSLSSPEFLAKPGTNHGFLLKHSTGSKPMNSEINVPLIYADYYFVEAFLRKTNHKL
jgi:unsaturated chondroitin disaccharide hydrolase